MAPVLSASCKGAGSQEAEEFCKELHARGTVCMHLRLWLPRLGEVDMPP